MYSFQYIILFFITTLLLAFTGGIKNEAYAQNFSDFPANSYQNGPLYWKKKSPIPGYWQQDVHYIIDAKLDVENEWVEGKEKLIYWNNSPDTIKSVYFHLYQNAFIKNSYYSELEKANNVKSKLSLYEETDKGTLIEQISQNGQAVVTELDNTILIVHLAAPIPPGGKTEFDIQFRTFFGRGSQRRRMKMFDVPEKQPYGSYKLVKHFDVVHWYPRVCVYDRKFRWETPQHLTKEFYGDFGTYDVRFSTDDNYVLDATGELLNENEVYSPELRQKLDIKNFKNKPLGSPAKQIIPFSGKQKTWKFHAENVHDFALTADPTYRIGEAYWNGVRCIALAQEQNAAGWQDAAVFTAQIIRVFSEDIGRYAYPKMIVADARDGMEYPMLTLDGGTTPDYKGLLVHEVGHNWFFGMLGTNETYRAMMDEGFTQFLTAWGMERLEGKYDPASPKDEVRCSEVYLGYLGAARLGYDGFLNTHSDDFHGALGHGGGYGQVYYKTATMLYNLQYVLGRDLFIKSMQFYFDRWKIAHPYPEDFRQAIIDYTKIDLNWFFDQWLETDKKIDYSLQKVKRKSDYLEITFKRKGKMQMPLDFDVVSRRGDTLKYTIPNTYFVKDEDKRKPLPHWLGWGKLNATYTARIPFTGKVKNIIIDPSYRLADVNLLDNSIRPIGKWSFMQNPDRIPVQNVWKRYLFNIHPNLWWNAYAGLQPGVTLNGSYFKDTHKFGASVWLNTGIGRIEPSEVYYSKLGWYGEDGLKDHSFDKKGFHKISYRFTYSTPLKISRLTDVALRAEFRDGLHLYEGGLSKKFAVGNQNNPNHTIISAKYKFMRRSREQYLNYLYYPGTWNIRNSNATIALGIERNYQYTVGEGGVAFTVRASGPGSDVRFATAKIVSLHSFRISNIFLLRTRIFAQYGDGFLPPESALYLSGGNPEEAFDNDFYRARGFFPSDWTNLGGSGNHFQFGGGLNLRAFGYMPNWFLSAPKNANGGASINGELEFAGLLTALTPRFVRNITSKLARFASFKPYLFYDGGALTMNDPRPGFDKIRMDEFCQDGGLGLALNLFGRDLSMNRRTLTVRFDMPFYMNRPPIGQDKTAFRWNLSVGRAF